MPVMDGFTATSLLREDRQLKDLPILAMTANATVEDRQRCLEAGMNEHIPKPINPGVLFEALLKWIPHGERDVSGLVEKQAAGDDPMPEIEGIDTRAGIDRLGGNVGAYRKLLLKFAENQGTAIDQIREAVEAGDGDAAIRAAHTLKGVSGSIGATAVQQAAAKLEAALKDAPNNLPGDLLAETEEALTAILEPIRSMADAGTGSTAKQPGKLPADLGEQLQKLGNLIDEYDTEAGDELDRILEQVGGTALHDELGAIRSLLEQYDFEGAGAALGPILERHG